VSITRLWHLTRRLYGFRGEHITPESITNGDGCPDLLAELALGGWNLYEIVLQNGSKSEWFTQRANAEKALCVLRQAENKFLFLWERCYADAESTMRAGYLSLLLSFAMLTAGAAPIFDGYYNDSNRSGSFALLLTVKHLFGNLTLGLFVCIVLYLMSSFFGRVLADRRMYWKYSHARLSKELSTKVETSE
jgi:hypothetical protein